MERASPQSSPPSWALPITFGAMLTFFGLWLSSVGTAVLPPPFEMVAGLGCCCGFIPFGIVPAWFALRRDPTLTPGQGMTLGFTAVGGGAIPWAGMMWWVARQTSDRSEFRAALQEQELTAEEIESVLAIVPYMPLIIAGAHALLGGVVAMLTIVALRPR